MIKPISDHGQPKIIDINFSFPDFAIACKKNGSFHPFIPEIQSILEPMTRLVMPSLTMQTQTFFDQLIIYVNLYQQAKNQPI